jgi:hypothetical protein
VLIESAEYALKCQVAVLLDISMSGWTRSRQPLPNARRQAYAGEMSFAETWVAVLFVVALVLCVGTVWAEDVLAWLKRAEDYFSVQGARERRQKKQLTSTD